ncbi:response regulator transcription factor [Streptomyces beihaiensis]|uniref:Helix-turn-helix transcriptional regulator n=1 Tax=Streptomyces beihaiensis TaxID=2984495 RepID=A0ABT3TRC5_9ACTN|nr:helix-turn-helix transcriptional regulator [Streptomyces beihaiensis]MCX3059576.1 helix-turn-helix transcriptional regulator [Streptomyces beihaiensis]
MSATSTSLRRHIATGVKDLGLPLTPQDTDRLIRYVIGCANESYPTATVELTNQRRAVLTGLALGETVAQTGRRLGISEHTVRTHRRLLYRQLGVHTGPAAVAAGIRFGALRVPSAPSVPGGEA